MMKWIYSICIIFMFSSCGKFLEDYSQHLVVPKSVNDFDELLLGNGYLNRKEVPELRYGTVAWWLHLVDDDINTVAEMIAQSAGTFTMDQYYFGYTTWQFEVGRSLNGLELRDDHQTWEELYQRINSMNIILEEVDNMPQNIVNDINTAWRIKGESYFLRAQYYFTLLNLYGEIYDPLTANTALGIPLKTTNYVEHDKEKESQFDRASVATVYDQIIKDLEQSIACFEKTNQKRGIYRASKEASLTLLSRVHLYLQQWDKAAFYGDLLIKENGTLLNYNLVESGKEALSISNPEILFSQGALNVQNSITGRGGDFCVTRDLYNTYSNDDYRKALFFNRIGASDSIALNLKFKRGLQISPISDLFLIRTAEAYLNAIEGYCMDSKLTEAKELLKVYLKSRMSSFNIDNLSESGLIQFIREERRRELCFEGHRWFDLRRYAKIAKQPFKKEIIRVFTVYNWNSNNVVEKQQDYKLLIDDYAYTFSIPKVVIDFDRGMVNNMREMRKPIDERILK